MIANKAQSIGASNTMFENAGNQRTQLDNANRANQQAVTHANVAKQDAYDNKDLLRTGTIKSELSSNIANLGEKTAMGMQEANQIDKDLAEVELLKQQYKDNGVWNRNIQSILDAYTKGTIGKAERDRRLAQANTGNINSDGSADPVTPTVLKIE